VTRPCAVERGGEAQPRVGRARVADREHGLVARKSFRDRARDPRMRRGDDHLIGLLDPCLGKGSADGLADQRHVDLEPESLLPLRARDLTGQPPTVEELGRGRSLGDYLDGGLVTRPEQERDGTVGSVPLLDRGGEPRPEVRKHRKPAGGRCRAQRPDRRPR
jgi:hypothetical protein